MAPKEAIEAEAQAEVEATDDASQTGIPWAEDLLEDFKPRGIDAKGNGEATDDVDPELDADPEPKDDAVDDTLDETAIKPDTISEADYTREVAIKGDDGSIGYKTVRQLIDEGMYKADWTRGKQDLARQRGHLQEDQSILDILDKDPHARDYLMKRLDDVKSGKPMETDDFDIPPEVLEQLPWLSKVKTKLMEHEVEISKSRTNREQTQADQTVVKIDSVMKAAQTAVEKETGSKLEPDVFRSRVGKNIIDSLDDSVPRDRVTSIAGQLILADKRYFLSKARESYQQEIELAKEKAINTAKQERAQKAQQQKPLKGGGTSAPTGDTTELKVVKDKNGRPDYDAFLENAFKQGGKGR